MDAKNFFDWLIDPIKNQYADFSGRTSRKAFWMFVLVNFIVSIIIGIIDGALGVEILSPLYALLLIVPSVAIGARRFHDINKSGWWQLIALIPLIGWIILIVWLARKGDAGPNRFGQPVATSATAPTALGPDVHQVPTPPASPTPTDTTTALTREEAQSGEEKKE